MNLGAAVVLVAALAAASFALGAAPGSAGGVGRRVGAALAAGLLRLVRGAVVRRARACWSCWSGWSARPGSSTSSTLGAPSRTGRPGTSDAEVALFLNDVKNLADGEHRVAARAIATLVRGARATASFARWAAALALTLSRSAVPRGRRPRAAPHPAGVRRAGERVERAVHALLMACSTIAILVTLGIVLSLIFETRALLRARVAPASSSSVSHWSPQTALRADQVGSSGSFGAVPVFAGTLLITAHRHARGRCRWVSCPAIYMTFYADRRVRAVAKPVLEILAGVPTVVYGFFAALTVAPFVRDVGASLGLDVASESALAAGLIMGVMIIPFVSSLSDDAITRGAAGAARRLLRARRDPLGDDPPGDPAGGAARHRRAPSCWPSRAPSARP